MKDVVKDTFKRYVDAVYPDVVLSEHQTEEIKRAFHAGAQFMLMTSMVVARDLSDSDAEKVLNSIENELIKFAEEVRYSGERGCSK